MGWAGRRRATYLGGAVLALLIALGVPLFFYFYEAPTCSDERQNGGELGVDCGGVCQKLCSFQVADPVVRWSRTFEVVPGTYSAVAYVENPNPNAVTMEAPYLFQLFDANNLLVAERRGTTLLLPGRITPIFESDLSTGERVPVRTFFEFEGGLEWRRAKSKSDGLSVAGRVLSRPDSAPRIDATLSNTSVEEFSDIEVVAVVFDTSGNAVAASQTLVELLPKNSQRDLVFTWPRAFAKRVEACTAPADIALLLDVSGSMNDDGANPPQPLSDAKEAAAAFIDRLDAKDRVGLITFATDARVEEPISDVHVQVRKRLLETSIDPEEEQGKTNIGDAVSAASRELEALDRDEHVKEVMVLLTDGRANAPEEPGGEAYALTQAVAAREQQAVFYTIGLGEQVNMTFLQDVAGATERVFQAVTSDELDGIYQEISAAICERGAAVIDIIPKTKDAFVLEGKER